jgi:hypothetical protein
MWPGKVFAFSILPTGEIVDLYQQYTTTRWIADLCATPNKKFMYVSANMAIDQFRIESNGDLLFLGAFTCTGNPGDIGITPNNEIAIVGVGGSNPPGWFLRISPSGELIDTYYRASTGIWINPRGNPIMYGGFPDEAIWVFHLDYAAGTVSRTQVIPWVCNNPNGMAYTPDGSLGLLVGYLGGSVDVRSFKIDTTETVSTTGAWDIGGTAKDIDITPNARFALISIDTMLAIFAIDTNNGIITDTGKRWRPPLTNFLPDYIRITADGKLAVIDYLDYRDWITTAFIGDNGDLTWTGYTFPFGATYVPGVDAVIDMELTPIYVTGVESSQWQLYE